MLDGETSELQEQHASVLCEANGFLLDNGTKLYSTQELCERNETFEVEKYLAGFLAIGDDSGGAAYVVPVGKNDVRVFSVGIGVMDARYLSFVADDIKAWLAAELIDNENDA